MTPERFSKLISVLNRRQPDLTLLTDQMHKPRNIAALVRTADAFGLMRVHMVWAKNGAQRPYRGTAMGSQQWVELCQHSCMNSAIQDLKAGGHQILAAHLSDQAVDYREIDYTRPTVLLLGNEKSGVSESAARLADRHIIIPMMGMVESFNVSVAAAVILAEARHQRAGQGMYATSRLEEDEYWETFFRWAHPKVAGFCQQRGIAFPPVDRETGEIIDASGWYASIRSCSSSS
ncbi:MAG: tRNA (guanosine(18)-2'-O)-methyltransferase TrmH [Gammaproteobacteria bacterium]|nr:MAG: tRNA (guanosine(18)-2'-O)-methyltransferase TrmH [Pseudomonadota bacterium]PIE37884.1 MAG: tRNA (guanosine(18)-2'-O)-methyltransferase TrmH [Gammaproteobacteria bacterium]